MALLTNVALLDRYWGDADLSPPVLAIALTPTTAPHAPSARVAWLNGSASHALQCADAGDVCVRQDHESNPELFRMLMHLASKGVADAADLTATIAVRSAGDNLRFQLRAAVQPCLLDVGNNPLGAAPGRGKWALAASFACLPWLRVSCLQRRKASSSSSSRSAAYIVDDGRERDPADTAASIPALVLVCCEVLPLGAAPKPQQATRPSETALRPRQLVGPMALTRGTSGPLPSSSAAFTPVMGSGAVSEPNDPEGWFLGDPWFGRLALQALPGAVTVIAADSGSVLLQNPTSLIMYGNRTAKVAVMGTPPSPTPMQHPVVNGTAAEGFGIEGGARIGSLGAGVHAHVATHGATESHGGQQPQQRQQQQQQQQQQQSQQQSQQLLQLLRCHRQQFLGELFSSEPWRLGDVLADVVMAGGMWQGIVRVHGVVSHTAAPGPAAAVAAAAAAAAAVVTAAPCGASVATPLAAVMPPAACTGAGASSLGSDISTTGALLACCNWNLGRTRSRYAAAAAAGPPTLLLRTERAPPEEGQTEAARHRGDVLWCRGGEPLARSAAPVPQHPARVMASVAQVASGADAPLSLPSHTVNSTNLMVGVPENTGTEQPVAAVTPSSPERTPELQPRRSPAARGSNIGASTATTASMTSPPSTRLLLPSTLCTSGPSKPHTPGADFMRSNSGCLSSVCMRSGAGVPTVKPQSPTAAVSTTSRSYSGGLCIAANATAYAEEEGSARSNQRGQVGGQHPQIFSRRLSRHAATATATTAINPTPSGTRGDSVYHAGGRWEGKTGADVDSAPKQQEAEKADKRQQLRGSVARPATFIIEQHIDGIAASSSAGVDVGGDDGSSMRLASELCDQQQGALSPQARVVISTQPSRRAVLVAAANASSGGPGTAHSAIFDALSTSTWQVAFRRPGPPTKSASSSTLPVTNHSNLYDTGNRNGGNSLLLATQNSAFSINETDELLTTGTRLEPDVGFGAPGSTAGAAQLSRSVQRTNSLTMQGSGAGLGISAAFPMTNRTTSLGPGRADGNLLPCTMAGPAGAAVGDQGETVLQDAHQDGVHKADTAERRPPMKARSLLFRQQPGGGGKHKSRVASPAAALLTPRSFSVCLPNRAHSSCISLPAPGTIMTAAASISLHTAVGSGVVQAIDSNCTLLPPPPPLPAHLPPNSLAFGTPSVMLGQSGSSRRHSSRVLAFAASLRGAPTAAAAAAGLQLQPLPSPPPPAAAPPSRATLPPLISLARGSSARSQQRASPSTFMATAGSTAGGCNVGRSGSIVCVRRSQAAVEAAGGELPARNPSDFFNQCGESSSATPRHGRSVRRAKSHCILPYNATRQQQVTASALLRAAGGGGGRVPVSPTAGAGGNSSCNGSSSVMLNGQQTSGACPQHLLTPPSSSQGSRSNTYVGGVGGGGGPLGSSTSRTAATARRALELLADMPGGWPSWTEPDGDVPGGTRSRTSAGGASYGGAGGARVLSATSQVASFNVLFGEGGDRVSTCVHAAFGVGAGGLDLPVVQEGSGSGSGSGGSVCDARAEAGVNCGGGAGARTSAPPAGAWRQVKAAAESGRAFKYTPQHAPELRNMVRTAGTIESRSKMTQAETAQKAAQEGLTAVDTGTDGDGAGGQGKPCPECWHEVVVVGMVDPATGEKGVVVMQKDVTAKVVAERHVAQVSETEHRLLEQIFPRHVLQYMTEQVPSTEAGDDDLYDETWRPYVRDCTHLATLHSMVTLLFADIPGS